MTRVVNFQARSSPGPLLGVVVGLVLSVSWCPAARGEHKTIIDLQVSHRERPSHVCVIYQTAFKDDDKLQKQFLKDTLPKCAKKVSGEKGTASAVWRFSARQQNPWASSACPEVERHLTWVERRERRKALLNAVCRLFPRPRQEACGHGQGHCRSRIILNDTSGTIRCVPNDDPVKHEGRVLILKLNIIGGSTKVAKIRLFGRAVFISVLDRSPKQKRPRTVSQKSVTASVLGGHYVDGHSASSIGNRIRLPISPLCHEREIRLPTTRTLGRAHNLRVRLQHDDGSEVICPSRALDRSLRIAVPPGREGLSKTVSMIVLRPGPGKGGAPGSRFHGMVPLEGEERPGDREVARFETRWTGVLPPKNLTTRATLVTFAWERNCAYHVPDQGARCPAARLSDPGIDCMPILIRGGGRPSCRYRCRDGETSFIMPTTVRFTVGTQETRWTETLHYVGQTLTGYADRRDRQYLVDFRLWGQRGAGEDRPTSDPRWQKNFRRLVNRTGDRIRLVEVTNSSGQTYRFKPTHSQLVTIPDITCGALLRYRILGDGEYREGTVKLDEGRLVIPHPSETRKIFSMSASIGPGIMWHITSKHNLPESAFGIVQGGLRAHLPFDLSNKVFSLSSVEVNLAYMHSNQFYLPVTTQNERKIKDAHYGRVLISAVPTFQMPWWFWSPNDFYLGLGLASVGLGVNSLRKDRAAVGYVEWFWSPMIFGRVRVGRQMAIEASIRFIVPNRIFEYSSDNEFQGSPKRTTITAWSLMLGAGLRYWWSLGW